MTGSSNFPKALDGAFLSRADQIITIGLPVADACQKIVKDTVGTLAKKFHKLDALLHARGFSDIGTRCHGLDGRQIRKAVLSALTLDKTTAADPNHLTLANLLFAVDQAKQESKNAK
jgi:AAA+ superfamily predicted ATPase